MGSHGQARAAWVLVAVSLAGCVTAPEPGIIPPSMTIAGTTGDGNNAAPTEKTPGLRIESVLLMAFQKWSTCRMPAS